MKYPGLSVSDVIRMVQNNPNPTRLEMTMVSGLELQRDEIKRLENALETCQEEAARVRWEALLEAAGAVCYYCEQGKYPLEFDKQYGYHHRIVLGPIVRCYSHAIWEKLADQPQDDQKNVE